MAKFKLYSEQYSQWSEIVKQIELDNQLSTLNDALEQYADGKDNALRQLLTQYIDSEISTVNQTIANLPEVDVQAIMNELSLKADKTEVTSAINTANQYTDQQIANLPTTSYDISQHVDGTTIVYDAPTDKIKISDTFNSVTVVDTFGSTSAEDALSVGKGTDLDLRVKDLDIRVNVIEQGTVKIKNNEYVIKAVDNQSVFLIENSEYTPTTHGLLLFRNSTKVNANDYVIESDGSDGYQIKLNTPVSTENDTLDIEYNIVLIEGQGNGGTGSGGSDYVLPVATPYSLGGVRPDGSTITITPEGIISSTGGGGTTYELPIATSEVLGGIKPDGTTLAVDPITGVASVIGGGGGSIDPSAIRLNASQINESTNQQFVTASEKATISSTQQDLAGQGQRISTLENQVSNVVTSDEKVKFNVNDVAGYLEDKIDGATLRNVNGQLRAYTLQGMSVSVSDLNLLQGATSNIQAQINGLASITSVETIVNTENELPSTVPSNGTIVLVRSDSTQDGVSTYYISNNGTWQFVARVDSGLTRDFTTNPIQLVDESTGMLPKSRYELQTANDVEFNDTSGQLVATNINDALIEVFQKSENLKSSIASILGNPLKSSDNSMEFQAKLLDLMRGLASAISDRGVPTYYYNSLEEMANKVRLIPTVTVNGGAKKTTRLNVTSGYTQNIVLNEPLNLNDITATVIEFIAGDTGVVHYNIGFDMTDLNQFEPNSFLILDGTLRLVDYMRYTKEDLVTTDNSYVSKYTIQRSDFENINQIII
jgi:hypothetical protein